METKSEADVLKSVNSDLKEIVQHIKQAVSGADKTSLWSATSSKHYIKRWMDLSPEVRRVETEYEVDDLKAVISVLTETVQPFKHVVWGANTTNVKC